MALALLYATVGKVAAIEGEEALLLIDNSLKEDGARPDLVDVAHRITGIVCFQINTLVAMAQVELAAVVVVAILDIDEGLTKVGEAKEELFFNFAKLPRGNLVEVAITVVAKGEELIAQHKLRGQELIDEGNIIVEPAHLEDLLTPQAKLTIPVTLGANILTLVILLTKLALVPAIFNITQ